MCIITQVWGKEEKKSKKKNNNCIMYPVNIFLLMLFQALCK